MKQSLYNWMQQESVLSVDVSQAKTGAVPHFQSVLRHYGAVEGTFHTSLSRILSRVSLSIPRIASHTHGYFLQSVVVDSCSLRQRLLLVKARAPLHERVGSSAVSFY